MNRTVKLEEIDSDIYPLNRNGLNAFKSKHLMCFRLKLSLKRLNVEIHLNFISLILHS